MKIILRILVILLVGVLISGALYLTIENTSLLASDASGFPEGVTELSKHPEMSASDMGELPERSEGSDDHHAASLSRGLSEISVSLAKISGITLLVLLIQNLFARLNKRRATKPALE